jgi:hypothetical protein
MRSGLGNSKRPVCGYAFGPIAANRRIFFMVNDTETAIEPDENLWASARFVLSDAK